MPDNPEEITGINGILPPARDFLDELSRFQRMVEQQRERAREEAISEERNNEERQFVESHTFTLRRPPLPSIVTAVEADERGNAGPTEVMDDLTLETNCEDPEPTTISTPPPQTEAPTWRARYQDLSPSILTEEEAIVEGYAPYGQCNCTHCRGERMVSPTNCLMLINNPALHNRFDFKPWGGWAEDVARFMPLVDERYNLGRHHLISICTGWGGEIVRQQASVMHQGLLGKCSVCDNLLYIKARQRLNSFSSHSFTKLPDGRWVCTECLESIPGIFTCDLCHTIDLLTTGEGDEAEANYIEFRNRHERYRVCQSCYEEDTQDCWGCDEHFPTTPMSEGDDGHMYCDECWNQNFIHCVDCDETCSNNNAQETRSGDWVCESCYDNGWRTCHVCNRAVRSDDGSHAEDDPYGDGEWTCNRCLRNAAPQPSRRGGNLDELLREHSFKPRPFFRTTKGESIKDTLFFGFELETENILNRHSNDDHILWATKFWDDRKCGKFCYYKRDGSLHNGIEIVSHPMSWSWLQQNKPLFIEFLAGLRNRGLRSFNTETCGLHIHMNKEAYFGTRLYKYLKFFHTNGDFLWKISGRPSFDHMSEWAQVDTEGASRRILLQEAKEKYKRDGGKYWAINLEPEHTIEIRIFKGTLGEVSFFRAFEFVRSLYEFCAPGVVRISEVKLGRYIQYVRENAETYPNLKARLDSPRFQNAEADEAKEN